MPMIPNLDNGGRWHHIASERELTRALRSKNQEVIECPAINITFLIDKTNLTVVRAGAGGGDVFAVEGGWVYPNAIALAQDREEWRLLERIPGGAN